MTDISPINLNRNANGSIPLKIRLKLFKSLASSQISNQYKRALVLWLRTEAPVTSTTLPAYAGVPIYTVLNAIESIASLAIW